MEEDWGAEAAARPEPTFSLTNLTPARKRPKQSYLKYLKTVHGRDMAAKARAEFRCFKVTEENFMQWKEKSLLKGIDEMENSPKISFDTTELALWWLDIRAVLLFFGTRRRLW